MAAALLCMGMLGMQAQTLQFNSNKKFKIVQFTDVHWVPGNPASEEAAERMNEILDPKGWTKHWNLPSPATFRLPSPGETTMTNRI